MRCYGFVSGLFHFVTDLFYGVAELLFFSVSQYYPAASLQLVITVTEKGCKFMSINIH